MIEQSVLPEISVQPRPCHQSYACDVVWFRDNLRIYDNDALLQASASSVICVYILDPRERHTARFYWLKETLFALDESLRSMGTLLYICESVDPLQTIREIAHIAGARNLYLNASKSPSGMKQETELLRVMPSHTVIHICGHPWLIHPHCLVGKSGKPFQKFAHFYNALVGCCERNGPPQYQSSRPSFFISPPSLLHPSYAPPTLLSGRQPRWSKDLLAHWSVGEEAIFLRIGLWEKKRSSCALVCGRRSRPRLAFQNHLSNFRYQR